MLHENSAEGSRIPQLPPSHLQSGTLWRVCADRRAYDMFSSAIRELMRIRGGTGKLCSPHPLPFRALAAFIPTTVLHAAVSTFLSRAMLTCMSNDGLALSVEAGISRRPAYQACMWHGASI